MNARLLRTLYDRAASGLPFLGTPTGEVPPDLADPSEQESSKPQSSLGKAEIDKRAHRLINRYVALSGATGFAFGLPGYSAMPLTIPTNVASILLLQFHLCASLAALGGRDPQEESVRERSIECVLNSRELDVLSENTGDDPDASNLADRIASKLSERGARLIGEVATGWIQKAVGQTARSTGFLRPRNLPLLGGVFGALNDGASTRAVGKRAQDAFLTSPTDTPSTD